MQQDPSDAAQSTETASAPETTPPSGGYAPDSTSEAAEPLPYDPALDAPGYGRIKPGIAAGESNRSGTAKRNPLRFESQPQAELNPLREERTVGPQAFAPTPYGSALDGPAGGSAPPENRSLEEPEPQTEPLSAEAPPSINRSLMRSMAANSVAVPEAAASAPESSPTYEDEREQAESMARVAMGEPPLASDTAQTAQAGAPSNRSQPFDTITVFYGTDRKSWQPSRDNWSDRAERFWPMAAALISAGLFGFIAAMWRRLLSAMLSIGSLGIAALLGYTALTHSLEQHRIADKEGVRYLAERALNGEVQLGVCEVTIPKTHDPGELEAPSILKLELREDATRHVVLQKTQPLAGDEFHQRLRDRVAVSPGEELFVFVHGFNVSFENAARRTAQMAHDLKYEGAPVFFSWPANDKFLLTYAQDETNVSWAAPHLKRFLLDIARNSEAKSINVIAHSMGNRALTAVLRDLELEFRDDSRLFNQVVLAAPDIDAEDFRQNIAPYIQRTSRRITLYASSNDQALAASQLVHRYPRAGDSGRGLVLVPGIETVDVSAIDGGPWGHSYYGSSDPILRDLAVLFRGDNLTARNWLLAQDLNGMQYWVFQAQAASARAATAEALR